MTGTMTFVLHTHLPYCRLAGRWPHGEEWLHEAMLECYLPLIRTFRELATDGSSLGITMNVTPVLAEQMADGLIREHFRDYMSGQIGRAQSDLVRFKSNGDGRAEIAAFHLERYLALQGFYEHELGGDPLRALAELEDLGAIEIATSAATHAYLPLLSEAAARFQIETGIRSHRRIFGREPRAFWLPECAYRPGLEDALQAAGVRVFFAETHMVAGGESRGKGNEQMVGGYPGHALGPVARKAQLGTPFEAYTVGGSDVAVLARNERTGIQVWSATHGYPGDPAYREFHKKDEESGLRYWRVSEPGSGLGEKHLYEPRAAAILADQHAEHFREVVCEELGRFEAETGRPGTLLAAYDTELFGHWWLEGVRWLAAAVRAIRDEDRVNLCTASEAIERHPPERSIELSEGSWGYGGDDRTWNNPGTRWMLDDMRRRADRASELLGREHLAAQQLARELLLLQSSDWEFLVTTGQAKEYAEGRFREHTGRFDALADAIEANAPGIDALSDELFALDNCFPQIDPAAYGRSGQREMPA